MPKLSIPIAAASVRARFPELLVTSYPDPVLEQAARLAMRLDSTGEEAALHLAAHLAVYWTMHNTAEPDGGSGVIRHESTGPFNQSFATMVSSGMDDVFFETTSYGRTYLVIRNRTPRAVFPLVAG